MCDANFQCCLHTQYDQGFSPAVYAKVRARSFQWWRISCHIKHRSYQYTRAALKQTWEELSNHQGSPRHNPLPLCFNVRGVCNRRRKNEPWVELSNCRIACWLLNLLQAGKRYHANKWTLEIRRVPLSQGPRYFDSVVSSGACLAGGNRTIYQERANLGFENFTDPLWARCRALTGRSNGMKSCTLGMNELHILLPPRRLRVGPKFVLVRFTLPGAPFIIGYEKVCTGNPWGKGGLGGSGRTNWGMHCVSKGWFTGGKQRKTMTFGTTFQ